MKQIILFLKSTRTLSVLKSSIITILMLLLSSYQSNAANYFSRATGNWTTNTTWSLTSGGAAVGAGVFPIAGDNVTIEGGFNVTLTANAACANVTFTTTTATSLTLAGFQLASSGTITLPRSGAGINLIAVGTGTLSAANIAFISAGGAVRHQITISSGTVTVTGNITTNPTANLSPSITFTAAGLLQIGGTMYTAADGVLTTFAGSTVEYTAAGAQTIGNFTYQNLTLKGSGAKTVTGATVNATLSLQGTATAAGTTPTYGANAILEYKGSAAQTTTLVEFPNTLAADVTIDNAAGVTLNAAKTVGGTLTMTNGTLNMADLALTVGSLTGSGNITNSTGGTTARTLTIGSDNLSLAAYSGIISNGTNTGGVSLTKNGTGVLILSGLNTYTGKTTISAGTISINTLANVSGGSSSLGAPTTTGNGTIDIGATGILSYTGSGHASNRVVNLTASGGSIDASGSGSLTLSGGVTGNLFNLILTGTGLGSESGVIATTTGTLTKNGTGTWNLSGSNSYSGATTVSAGILRASTNNVTASANGPFGNNASGLNLGGGTIESNVTTFSRPITVTATNSGLDAYGSARTISSTINLATAGTFNLNVGGTTVASAEGQDLTLSAIISNSAGTLGLTKIGTSTVVLSAVNTYAGATIINSGGTLKLGAANRIAAASTLTVDGTFDLAGFSQTVSSLAGGGLVTSTATGSITLTTSGAGSTTFSGVIENGSATSVGLTRSGTGVLTLSGANTYTGTTTISGGTIQLGAAGVLPDVSPVTLSGGTLRTGAGAGFSETIGVLTLSASSTITLGTGSHTLTIANSSGATWGAFVLTIGSWTGVGGSLGTGAAGKIIVGSGGLIAGQLAKITFTGYAAGSLITASGECVPNVTYYYSQTSGSPTTLANWNTVRGGGGSTPASFILNGTVFVIQGSGNGGTTPHTMTNTAAWGVGTSGSTNSSILIENGATLVAAATFPVTIATTSTFYIQNGGTYKHQNTTAFGSSIFQGTEVFEPSSTVELNNSSTTGPSNVVFGNLTVNFTANPGGAVNLGGAITTINGNLTVQNTNAQQFRFVTNSNVTMNIGGNLTITGGTLNMSSGSGIVTVNLQGDYTHTAGTVTVNGGSGSGTIVFNGTGIQTYTSGGTLTNNISHVISSGATVDFGTSFISNGATGTFNLNSGGKIITANTAGLTTSGATGSVRSTGTRTYSSAASYEFQGSNTGAFTLSTPNTITGTLTFNRSGGVTIDQNFTASTLALTDGAVTTGALLSITIPSGGTYTGASSTAYVSGILNRVYTGASSLVFPVGKSGNYRPVTFEYTSVTGTSTVSIEQKELPSTFPGTLPASTNLNNSRYWDISQSGGSSLAYKITLDGTGDAISGTVVILKSDGGTVTSHAATATAPNYTNTSTFTTLTGTAISFTLGSTCTVTADAGSDQTGAPTCGLTTVTLSAVTPAFGTGQWSIVGGLGGSFTGGSGNPSNSNSINPDFNGVAGVTYTLQYSISNGACSASDPMTVTFNQNPTTADAGPDQTDVATCGLTTVSLAANTPSVGTGGWSVVSGVGGSFSNSASPTSTFSGTPGVSYTLRWTIANSPCTASTNDVDITFNIEPTASVAGSDQNFCLLTTATLAANTPSVGTGLWSISSGPSTNLSQISSLSNPAATFTPDGGLGPYVLVWTITNAPCESFSSVTLTTISGPWIGSVSTDWSDAANWCGGIPTATTDVTLSNGATYYPNITGGSQSAQTIEIESAASLTIDGGSLTSGVIHDDGTLTVGASGTLNMTSNQVTGSGDVFIDGTFKTSNSDGFSGSTTTAVKNTVGSLVLGTASTIDYSGSGSQTITEGNYANTSNSGNGNRTLSSTGTIGISDVLDPGTGDYSIGTSTVEFNGTGPQDIPALAPDSKYYDLIINNSGTGVTMVADLNLEDAITLTDGAFTTTGFAFTLLSTATLTARIAPVTGGSLVGDVTMQRFIPAGATNWSTIGMPVVGATLAQWNDDIATSGYTGSTYGAGIFHSVYTYDETVTGLASDPSAYVTATNSTNSVDPKAGYFVYLDVSGNTIGSKTIDVTGQPLIGNQIMNVTVTNGGISADEDGWNLINNPFCSAIDWNSPDWTKTDIDDAIYYYDRLNDQYAGYVGGPPISGAYNGGSNIIASSQAFFVHAVAGSPSLVATEDVKVSTNPAFFKQANTVAAGMIRMQLDGINGKYKDESVLRTYTGATTTFDKKYDAYKLYSFNPAAPNICSKMGGIEYAVNTIDELTGNFDLPVRVNVNTAGSYTINFKGLQNFASVNCLTFEDKLTNTFVDLHIDSTYTFTSVIDTVKSYARFTLHFGLDPLLASIVPSANTVSFPGSTEVNFTNTSTGASAYTWDFGDGSPVETSENPSHTYASVGNYTVTLTASNSAGCSAPQTATVLITVDDVTGVHTLVAAESISILKNEQGVYANYNFKNKTKVSVSIYDVLGKKIGTTQQCSVQNAGKFKVHAPELAKGVYTIEMLYNDKKTAQKIEY